MEEKLDDRDERIMYLAQECIREINLYFMAQGRTQDTFYDVLKALSLVHRNLWS